MGSWFEDTDQPVRENMAEMAKVANYTVDRQETQMHAGAPPPAARTQGPRMGLPALVNLSGSILRDTLRGIFPW